MEPDRFGDLTDDAVLLFTISNLDQFSEVVFQNGSILDAGEIQTDSREQPRLPEADLTKKYVFSRWVGMMWPYDEKVRMIGEHVYPGGEISFRECPEADFIDTKQVLSVYSQLIEKAKGDLNDSRRQMGLRKV